MDVSVIIVNYRTTDLIIDCLKSLFRLTEGVEFEIIVVDNNSEPDFSNRIAGAFPQETANGQVRFLPLPENVGFGRANNAGFAIANGRHIFFLNPDTVLLSNAVKILSDFLDSHEDAGACGGNLLSESMGPALSFRRILPGIRWETNELLNRIPEKIIYGKRGLFETREKPCEVAYISGADLMVRREIIEQTRGFSPEFFMYYEETDLCARIRRAGWRIFVVPAARIQHLDGKSFGTPQPVNAFKIDILEKSRTIFYRRNVGSVRQGLSNLIYHAYLLSRVILLPDGAKREGYKLQLESFKKHKKDKKA